MDVKAYCFSGLTFEIHSPFPMLSDDTERAFAVAPSGNADYIYRIFPESQQINPSHPIRVERNGKELSAYMDTALLPGISVTGFLCGADTAHLLPERGRFLLHASYVLFREKAILFTAPSQTGKSTQAHFWEKANGAKIINEDRVIISHHNGVYYANGCWAAGTAGVSHNKTAPIRAVVLLGQGEKNCVSAPLAAEKLRRLIPQCTFDETNISRRIQIIDEVSKLIERVPIVAFDCLNHISAVEELERFI